MPEILGICLLVGYAVVSTKFVMDEHKEIKKQEQEEEEFQRSREKRQQEFDKHAQDVAKAVLFNTCETIYIGRWHKDDE